MVRFILLAAVAFLFAAPSTAQTRGCEGAWAVGQTCTDADAVGVRVGSGLKALQTAIDVGDMAAGGAVPSTTFAGLGGATCPETPGQTCSLTDSKSCTALVAPSPGDELALCYFGLVDGGPNVWRGFGFGASNVTSVFTRTGAVVAATSDYDAVQIDNTPFGAIAATDVQAAIDELETEKSGTAHAHTQIVNADGGGANWSWDPDGYSASLGCYYSDITQNGQLDIDLGESCMNTQVFEVANYTTYTNGYNATHIQAAIDDACQWAGGKGSIVRLPAQWDSFRIDETTININCPIILEGAGGANGATQAQIMYANPGATPAFDLFNITVDGVVIRNVRIVYDMSQGEKNANTTAIFVNAGKVKIIDSTIVGDSGRACDDASPFTCAGAGIRFGTPSYENIVSGTSISHFGIGVKGTSTNGPSASLFQGNHIAANGIGYDIPNTGGLTWVQETFDGPNEIGINFGAAITNATIIGGHFENCANLQMTEAGSTVYVSSHGAKWQGGGAPRCPAGVVGRHLIGAATGTQVWRSFGDQVGANNDITIAAGGDARIFEQEGTYDDIVGTITKLRAVESDGCTDRQVPVWDNANDRLVCSDGEVDANGQMVSKELADGSNVGHLYANESGPLSPAAPADGVDLAAVDIDGDNDEEVCFLGQNDADTDCESGDLSPLEISRRQVLYRFKGSGPTAANVDKCLSVHHTTQNGVVDCDQGVGGNDAFSHMYFDDGVVLESMHVCIMTDTFDDPLCRLTLWHNIDLDDDGDTTGGGDTHTAIATVDYGTTASPVDDDVGECAEVDLSDHVAAQGTNEWYVAHTTYVTTTTNCDGGFWVHGWIEGYKRAGSTP